MRINEKLAVAMNDQVTAELEAAMVYLQISYILEDLSLTGMASWMKKQHEEELEHAQAFAQHLLERNYRPQIGDIAPPKLDVTNPVEAFEAALAHEQKVTGLIREIAVLSDSLKDFESRPFLDGFLAEQIEEETTVEEILDRLKLAGEGLGYLYMDAELGKRK
ncbi:ferritin-like domain-containing protein [Corynebacterium felinum]|uniref:Ferritin n=1 Tax=Corynebacterium felinum TaxID=131318 RepID=A0ABU2B4Z6_9CORY|nr:MULTISPECIES: ferritin-like domain-containing protein [Corynebacterium]MDF5820318.1 ferritin-like domain-containing protein [Corynebacterium felinum]MDO4762130.1 ferritin-like domain-containing protein [Corynebacterium sp.]MDR7353685.1 ferritin [Corynebacterium felinum]